MDSLRVSLEADAALQPAVAEVLSHTEESAPSLHILDVFSRLDAASPAIEAIISAAYARPASLRDYSTPCSDEYCSSLTEVMDWCLELAAICHVKVNGIGIGSSASAGGTIDKDTAEDAGESLRRLPGAWLTVVRFCLLQALPPSPGSSAAPSPGDEKGEQQLPPHLLAGAALAVTALATATAELVAIVPPGKYSSPEVSSALVAVLQLVRACSADVPPPGSEVHIAADDLCQPSPHERQRWSRLQAQAQAQQQLKNKKKNSQRVREWGHERESGSGEQQSFQFGEQWDLHANLQHVSLQPEAVLAAGLLRCSSAAARAVDAALRILLQQRESPVGAQTLSLAHANCSIQTSPGAGAGAGAADASSGSSHTRADFLTARAALALLPAPGSSAVLKASDARVTSTLLALALTLASRAGSGAVGTFSALPQLRLAGALLARATLRSVPASELAAVAPWAAPSLLRAWQAAGANVDTVNGGARSVRSAPSEAHSRALRGKNAPTVYITALLLSRALHDLFSACSANAATAGCLHGYLDSLEHRLGVHSSDAGTVWALLSHVVPLWAALAGGEGPPDGVVAAAEARLQPTLGALLGALNACWHLPIQYTVLRSLALLARWQLRTEGNSRTPMAAPLVPLVPVVAVECHRVLAFYDADSDAVDLTAASAAARAELRGAAREVLRLLEHLNAGAVEAVGKAAALAAATEKQRSGGLVDVN